MGKGLRFTGWLGLLAIVWITGCGTKSVGISENGQPVDERDISGVRLQDFEVVRYNTEGFPDSSLNDTLALSMTNDKGLTGLVISVRDSVYTSTVALDVKYRNAVVHPERVQFHGLLGPDDQILTASFLSTPGVAGLGQTGIRDYRPARIDGRFATVYFATGATREVRAVAGGVHHNSEGVGDTVHGMANLTATSDVPSQTGSVTWTAAWHRADGDQNSEVNIADISPIGQNYQKKPSLDWRCLPADYDDNDEVFIADLTPIGIYYQEGTLEYLVEAADDGLAATNFTTVGTLDWEDNDTDPSDPTNQTPTTLGAIFRSWTVDFGAATPFPFASLNALDIDTNQQVQVRITPIRGTGPNSQGVPSTINVTVGTAVPPQAILTITDYDIKFVGATGGSGDGTIFSGGAQGTVEANATVTVTLNTISGSFNGPEASGDFTSDPGSFPTGMSQADYDLAFESVRDQLNWQTANQGDANARYSQDWLLFLSGPGPKTGDPGAGAIFPDDDPESDASTPEGLLSTSLPAEGGGGTYPETALLNINVLADIDNSFDFDVTTDPDAPLTGAPQGQLGEITELVLNTDNFITMDITFGAGGVPGTFDTTQLQLLGFTGGVGMPVGLPVDFIYVDDQPDQGGEFNIRDNGIGGWVLSAMVPGIQLTPSGTYHFRFNDTNNWSTLNKPAEVLTTAPPPPPQTLITVPEIVGSDNHSIQIFYEDPVVRRVYRLKFDPFAKSAAPYPGTEQAFDDVLKTTGDEFLVGYGPDSNPGLFPKVYLKEGTNPNIITDPDDPSNLGPDQGIFFEDIGAHPGRAVVNIQALPPPVAPETERHWVYKLFNADGSVVGQGSFDFVTNAFSPPAPVPIEWGVNIFNRDTTEFDARDYTDKQVVSGISIDSATPDVLWFEFSDGTMNDWDETLSPAASGNVHVEISDEFEQQGSATMKLSLRIAGIGSDGAYLCIHPLTSEDFVANPPIGGWPGILVAGFNYLVKLDDPRFGSGPEVTYSNMLFVGSDPPAPNPDPPV